jgi:hypothetical protein
VYEATDQQVGKNKHLLYNLWDSFGK